MTAWLIVDGMALLLAGAYLLSVPLSLLPLPAGDVRSQEREAWRRLVFPLFGSAVIVASGAGSTAWDAWRQMADHCGSALVHEPYFCGLHPVVGGDLPWGDMTIGVLLLASFFAAASGLLRSYRANRSLHKLAALSDPAAVRRARRRLAEAGARWHGRLAVVASDKALCFVFDPASPTIVLSTEVVDALPARTLAAMIAHERAHIDRRDTFWRPVVQLLLLFHAPWFGDLAYRRWIALSELACDASAAERLGSRSQVAEALIAYQRLRLSPLLASPASVGFADATLEARVVRLIEPEAAGAATPWRAWPLAFCLAAVLAAPALHRALEGFLNLLHA